MTTIIRAVNLMIEAEAVIAAIPAPVSMMAGPNQLGRVEIRYLKADSDSERSVQFFLEAGGNFIWLAESEAEARRVVDEIAAAKVGVLLNYWTATIRKTEHTDEAGWTKEEFMVPVDALTHEQAVEEVKANLPGNVQNRKFEIVEVVPGSR